MLYNRKESEGVTEEIRGLYLEWINHIKEFPNTFGEDCVECLLGVLQNTVLPNTFGEDCVLQDTK